MLQPSTPPLTWKIAAPSAKVRHKEGITSKEHILTKIAGAAWRVPGGVDGAERQGASMVDVVVMHKNVELGAICRVWCAAHAGAGGSGGGSATLHYILRSTAIHGWVSNVGLLDSHHPSPNDHRHRGKLLAQIECAGQVICMHVCFKHSLEVDAFGADILQDLRRWKVCVCVRACVCVCVCTCVCVCVCACMHAPLALSHLVKGLK